MTTLAALCSLFSPTPLASVRGIPAAQSPDGVTISRKVGATDVSFKIPGANPNPGAGTLMRFESEGWKVFVRSDGTLTDPIRADGKWGEYAPTTVKADAKMWRIKVFVINRVYEPHKVSGFGHQGVLDKGDHEALNRAMALNANRIELASQGNLKVEYSVDYDSAEFYPTDAEGLSEEGLWRYVHPRINSEAFESIDKIDRGPWDQVFVIHAGWSIGTSSWLQYGNFITSLSYFRDLASQSEHYFADLMYEQFGAALGVGRSFQAVSAWPAPSSHQVAVSPLDYGWSKEFSELSPKSASFSGPKTPKTNVKWKELEAIPWTHLDVTDQLPADVGGFKASLVSALTGDRRTEKLLTIGSSPGKVDGIGLDAVIRLETESCALVHHGESSTLFVKPGVAKVVGPHIKEHFNPRVKNIVWISERPFVQISLQNAQGLKTEAELVSTSVSGEVLNQATLTFNPETHPASSTVGRVETSHVQTNTGKPALQVEFKSAVRTGGICLFQAAPGSNGWRANGLTNFLIKGEFSAVEPARLDVYFAHNGKRDRATVGLFGATGYGLSSVPFVKSDPIPSEIVVPFNLPVGAEVKEVWLVTNDVDNPQPQEFPGNPKWKIESFGLAPTGSSGTVVPASPVRIEANQTGEDYRSRALFAASLVEAGRAEDAPTALALMTDKSDLVRFVACQFFSKVKHPPAEPKLTELSRSVDPWVGSAALDALNFQETESGHQAIRRAMEIGPGEGNRLFAIRHLAQRKRPEDAAAISAQFGARSWRSRKAAAEALGAIEGREPSLLLLVFLQEVDPSVRLAVTQRANVELDIACRRLLWSSVNDSSEAVRAESCIKLAGSSLTQFAAEGLKGVRDESWAVRFEIVSRLSKLKDEKYRSVFRTAVIDTNPFVRGEALKGFAGLPNGVQLDEIQNVATDQHPYVKSAYQSLIPKALGAN